MTLFYTEDGETWKPLPDGIRIALDIPVVNEGGLGELIFKRELVFNFTNEGLICDVFEEDEEIGTSSETFDEIVERLTGE